MEMKAGNSKITFESIKGHLSKLNNPKDFLKEVRKISDKLKKQREDQFSDLLFLESAPPLREKRLKIVKNNLETIEKNLNEVDFQEFQQDLPNDLIEKIKEYLYVENQLSHMKSLEQLSTLNEKLEQSFVQRHWRRSLQIYCEILNNHKEEDNFVEEMMSGLNPYLSLKLKHHILALLEQKLHYPFERPLDIDSCKSEIDELAQMIIFYLVVVFYESGQTNDDCLEISLTPLTKLLLAPLEDRFNFHFYGNRKTNSIEKPEWFFTQLLQWAKLHVPLVDELNRTLIRETETTSEYSLFSSTNTVRTLQNILKDSSIELNLQRGLVKLARDKITDVLGKIDKDPKHFSHLVDEIVNFEQELIDLGYPDSDEETCIELLAEKPLIDLWKNIEWEFNLEKIDKILAQPDAWESRYEQASNLDDFQVPNCVDNFVILLKLITDRYRLVRSIHGRLHFYELQLTLLDDFRTRILQIMRTSTSPWEKPFPQLINGVNFLIRELEDWNNSTFFILLASIRKQREIDNFEPLISSDELEIQGAFDNIIGLFELLLDDTIKELLNCLVNEELRSTLSESQYQAISEPDERNKARRNFFEISRIICPFLLLLRDRLLLLSEVASRAIWQRLGIAIRDEIGILFQRQLIDIISFNSHLAEQMLFDVSQGVLPLLQSFFAPEPGTITGSDNQARALERSNKQQTGMQQLIESLRILSLTTPNAILLRESLSRGSMPVSTTLIADFNVHLLSIDDIRRLIRQRIDLPPK